MSERISISIGPYEANDDEVLDYYAALEPDAFLSSVERWNMERAAAALEIDIAKHRRVSE